MTAPPKVSVVVPLYNELDNVEPLCRETAAAMDGSSYELVLVDDGSTDGTREKLMHVAAENRAIQVAFHAENAGQSAGLVTGIRVAQGPTIVTMDGDLQNDPADIPRLLDEYDKASEKGRVLITGIRVDRKDDWLKLASSRVANAFRRAVLKDGCEDTGCALKVFARDDFHALPPFDHIHRFLPAMFGASGVRAINVPVRHRPRTAGVSKYGVGNRLWVGLADVAGVYWLQRRLLRPKTMDPND